MKDTTSRGLSPAAVMAALSGNADNFFAASTPGGIEAQEAAGQATLVANSQLPKDGPRADLERLGFKFGADVDDIFVRVSMPEGWKKVATNHSMWSDLIDDKGRERGHIFYKAAFYDRRAHMNLVRRYNVNAYIGCDADGTARPENDYSHPYFAVAVTDCNKEIHRVGIVKRDAYTSNDDLEKKATAWLDSQFPQWKDATAYWD